MIPALLGWVQEANMIVQMIPADGWSVQYGQGSDAHLEPIIAWGLHDNGAVVPILNQDEVRPGDESDEPYRLVKRHAW